MRTIVMRMAWSLALVACGSEERAPAAGGSAGTAPVATRPAAPAPPPAVTEVVGCAPAKLAPQLEVPAAIVDGAGGSGTALALGTQPPPAAAPTGTLDKNIIRRYVRRNLPQIQYCYERELLAQPTLAGRIDVRFFISPDGTVTSAAADGMGRAVSECVEQVIKRIRFPKPVGGGVTVNYPFRFQSAGGAGPAVTPDPVPTTPPSSPPPTPPSSSLPTSTVMRVDPPMQWTPFASLGTVASEALAKPVADEAARLLRTQLPALDACFDGGRGAARAMIAFAKNGVVARVRAGGFGDVGVESCLAKIAFDVELGADVQQQLAAGDAEIVEVACDVQRGGPAPLRVSLEADYTVLQVTAMQIVYRNEVWPLPSGSSRFGRHPSLPRSRAVVIVADPDATAAGLEAVLSWTEGATTLLAVKASGGAPVFVGMGGVLYSPARRLELRTDANTLRACVRDSQLPATGRLVMAAELDRVLEAATAACKQPACDRPVIVGLDGDFVAKDLIATTSAARRAGHESLLVGGKTCQ